MEYVFWQNLQYVDIKFYGTFGVFLVQYYNWHCSVCVCVYKVLPRTGHEDLEGE